MECRVGSATGSWSCRIGVARWSLSGFNLSPPLPAILGPLSSLAASQLRSGSLHWLIGPFWWSSVGTNVSSASPEPWGQTLPTALLMVKVPGLTFPMLIPLGEGRVQAGMASSTWLAMAASIWWHWCHYSCPCAIGQVYPRADVQQTGPGTFPALPIAPWAQWELQSQNWCCQEEGVRHVVRLWLLPCLEALGGGGSIELP